MKVYALGRWHTVSSLEAASRFVLDTTESRDMGGTEWYNRGGGRAGLVVDRGRPIARVSYNGRIWAVGAKGEALRDAEGREVYREIKPTKHTRSNPRRMPQEAIDRNIQRDLEAVEAYVPEGEFGSVKNILTWLHGNEMSMIANFFVDTLRRGQFYQFYIDARVSGRPVSSSYSLGRVTKRDVNAAIRSLQEATKQTGRYHARSNPSKARKVRYKVEYRSTGGQWKDIPGKVSFSTREKALAAADALGGHRRNYRVAKTFSRYGKIR